MARCGCAGSVCACSITVEGLGEISGVGSEGNPYIIEIGGSFIEVDDTASVDLSIAGDGTEADPYVITAETVAAMEPSPQAAPLGSMLMYAGDDSDIPAGWFLCDGTSKVAATYPDLFGLIGYTYGGTGANFFLPDMRNRFPIGVSLPGGIAGFLADDEGETDPLDRTPKHTHDEGDYVATSSGSGHTHNLSISDPNMGTADNTSTGGAAKRLNGGEHHTHSGSTALSSGGSTHTHGLSGESGDGSPGESIMPFLAVNFIIKYLV